MDGVVISEAECARRWRAWTPGEVARRLAGVASWGVVGGWAIDLFVGRATRYHGDIEIAIPADRFPALAAAVRELEWDVVGDGRLWPYPAALGRFRQTWLREPASGLFLLDVFRESHDGATWTFRRDPSDHAAVRRCLRPHI